MKKTAIILGLSLLLNLIAGYSYFQGYVYQLGLQAGQQIIANEVNGYIQQGKLIIPPAEQPKVESNIKK